ncbi:MAG: hypothetical protein HQK58_07960 [Deltaproteobacteria bacterium]|nr:hypothetical protein [Deltaproteobacteria bacterium]
MKKSKRYHMLFIISVIMLLAIPSLSVAQNKSTDVAGVTSDVPFNLWRTGCSDADGHCYIFGYNNFWSDGRRFVMPKDKEDQYMVMATAAIASGRVLVIRVSDPANLGTLTKMEFGAPPSFFGPDAGLTPSAGK